MYTEQSSQHFDYAFLLLLACAKTSYGGAILLISACIEPLKISGLNSFVIPMSKIYFYLMLTVIKDNSIRIIYVICNQMEQTPYIK